jgi:hypothetical protein
MFTSLSAVGGEDSQSDEDPRRPVARVAAAFNPQGKRGRLVVGLAAAAASPNTRRSSRGGQAVKH